MNARGVLHTLAQVATDTDIRRRWLLRARHRIVPGDNLFQPSNDTEPDRYPAAFAYVRDQLGNGEDLRILSFGCSTGDEIFSLRRYFPSAWLKGIDISRGNVADCEKRRRAASDDRMAFAVAGSTAGEPTAHYDAIFAMAVFRHGDLSGSDAQSCRHRITFSAFESTVADLARCLRPGGFLAVEFSNFRFCDTEVAGQFECVLQVPKAPYHPQVPLFGRDDRRLDIAGYDDVVFRKHD